MCSDGPQPLGCLYLIPNLLGEASIDDSLPKIVATVISRISFFLVEEEKNARLLIKKLAPHLNLRDLSLEKLNEHTPASDLNRLMAPLTQGHDIGIISEAGCPAIADPGSNVVQLAHMQGITVRPLVGPCSMTLALMGSGFNGQSWRFVGYLPLDEPNRRSMLLRLEQEVMRSNETQIIMEPPYRNQRLLQDLIAHCQPKTRLCIASALTTAHELIEVNSIAAWKQLDRTLPKTPALFLLGN